MRRPSRGWSDAVDAAPPASGGLATLSVGGRTRPIGTRSAVPYGASQAAAFSAPHWARCPTSDAPCRHPAPPSRASPDSQDRLHPALVKGPGFHDPERLPSTGAPRGALSRCPGEPATVLAVLPPSKTASGILKSPSRFAPEKARRTASKSLRLGMQRVGHCPPTSAIDTVSEHSHGSNTIPVRLAGSCPPAGRGHGQIHTLRRRSGRDVTGQGATETKASPALLANESRGALPRAMPARTPPVTSSCPCRLESPDRDPEGGTEVPNEPAGGRRTRRRPHEGCVRPTPRERDRPTCTRGAFPRWAGRSPVR